MFLKNFKKQGNKSQPIPIKHKNPMTMKKNQKTSALKSIEKFIESINKNEILSAKEMRQIKGGDGDGSITPGTTPPPIGK